MSFQYKENTGSLFLNSKREKETSPHYSGELDVEGVRFFIDGWIREQSGKSGGKYLSIRVKRREKQPSLFEDDNV